MTSAYIQGDLFASPRPAYAPATAPRTYAMTSAPRLRKLCPFSVGGLPIAPTGDLEILVVDGVKNQTYTIE